MEKHRTNNRQNWIDIAKGILIFIVVLGHIGFCTKDETYKDVFGFTSQLALFYISYYIPAFFVITGMCTNFNVPFKSYFIKNFKALIIPNILIGVIITHWLDLFLDKTGLSYNNFLSIDYITTLWRGGGQWFLSALFVAKICMYFINRFLQNKKLIVWGLIFVLMLIASVLYNKGIGKNIWFYKHAVLLLPFMFFGYRLKTHQEWINNTSKAILIGLGGFALWLALPTIGVSRPYVIGLPGVYWGNFIFFVVCASMEIIALLAICKRIGKCRIMECVGKHTLTTYLLHFSYLTFLLRCSYNYVDESTNLILRIFIIIAILCITILMSTLTDIWIEKHLPFLKGK